jgi:hypothetical protein
MEKSRRDLAMVDVDLFYLKIRAPFEVVGVLVERGQGCARYRHLCHI